MMRIVILAVSMTFLVAVLVGLALPNDLTEGAEGTYSASQADWLFQGQAWDEAAEAYQWLAEKNPHDGLAWYRLAQANQNLDRPQEAIYAFRMAMTHNHEPAECHVQITRIEAARGRIELAFLELERAVRAGYDDRDFLMEDEALAEVRQHAQFEALIERLGRTPQLVNLGSD